MESPNGSESALHNDKTFVIPHHLIVTVLYYVIGTCITVVNSSILFAFLVQRIRRSNSARLSPAGQLVLNLLAADALVGVNIIALTATEAYAVETKWLCTLRLTGSHLTIIGSHVALINIAIDRYIAIIYTLQYRDLMTMKRSVTVILFGWLVPIAGAASALFFNDWRPGLIACEQMYSLRLFMTYVCMPLHVFALVIVIVFQCYFYLQLRRYERVRRRTTNTTVLKRYSKKSAQILLSVITTFVVCWGPFDVAFLVIIVWQTPVIRIIYDTLSVLAVMPFLVNPIIFSLKTQNIRKPVKDLYLDIKAALKRSETKAVTDRTEGGDKAAPTFVTIASGIILTQSTPLKSAGHM